MQFPAWGLKVPCLGLPGGLEPPGSGLCEFSWEHRTGRGRWRRAGAQIAWSVLRLTPGPEEDLTGDERERTTCRRSRGEGCVKFWNQECWERFQNRTSEMFGSFCGVWQSWHRPEVRSCEAETRGNKRKREGDPGNDPWRG